MPYVLQVAPASDPSETATLVGGLHVLDYVMLALCLQSAILVPSIMWGVHHDTEYWSATEAVCTALHLTFISLNILYIGLLDGFRMLARKRIPFMA
jgi:hypothetical protein